MASDLARAVRDRLAAGAALVAILVGVGAGVVWVAERSVKDAVTAAVNATVPGAIEAALNSREEATRVFIVDAVNEAVGRELQPLQDDVAALKLAQARTAGNPAVAAALFPSASWVSEFEKWAEANPDAGVSVVMGNWQSEPWPAIPKRRFNETGPFAPTARSSFLSAQAHTRVTSSQTSTPIAVV